MEGAEIDDGAAGSTPERYADTLQVSHHEALNEDGMTLVASLVTL